jgi:hypothetical protein
MPIHKQKNEHFFKEWTPQMAYILGFFAADGCMFRSRRGGYFIEFQITDRELLEAMRQALDSNHHIATLPVEVRERPKFRLQIGSKVWFEDLLRLGMTPKKSHTLMMPDIPVEHLRHFVRGYFDGDGNVYANEYARKGRKNPSITLLTGFTSGSRGFLEAFHERLRVVGIVSGGSVFDREEYSRLHYSVWDSCNLYRFMYNGEESSLCLKRKKAIFEGYFKRKGIVFGENNLDR